MTLVVDASVAAKWYFPEAGCESADALLARAVDGEVELVAPDLIIAEFTNVLWKKIRLEECRYDEAEAILALWETDRPRLLDSARLASRALELAVRIEHPVYDCLYLAAAIDQACALATADTRLARLARAVVSEVELVVS